MQGEYLICTGKNGVESYLPIDMSAMTKSGSSYTLKLPGKTVTLNVVASGKFTDLSPTGFYLDAVAWALANGVTTGTTTTTFDPNGICNRGQIVTFLHRAYSK